MGNAVQLITGRRVNEKIPQAAKEATCPAGQGRLDRHGQCTDFPARGNTSQNKVPNIEQQPPFVFLKQPPFVYETYFCRRHLSSTVWLLSDRVLRMKPLPNKCLRWSKLFDCFRLIKLLKEKHYFNSCKAFSNMWATAILSLISRQER